MYDAGNASCDGDEDVGVLTVVVAPVRVSVVDAGVSVYAQVLGGPVAVDWGLVLPPQTQ